MAKNVAFLLLSFLCLSSPLYAAIDFALYQDFIQWIISQQATFHRELVSLVRSISKGGSPVLLWGLISTSFFYGVFHAAGPGHGKAVISAYMLASKAPLRRGISLAFLCAGVQAVMAVLVIVVLSQVFSLAGKAMQISRFFEVASFAAVGLIGVWILLRLLRGQSGCGHDHSQDHLEEHHHDHSAEHHDHSHEHSHGHACCSHHKDEAKTARRSIWAMVAAVGIRPCTGAILVLLFSLSTGIFVWGLVATFAMALGTAITVAALAGVSVFVRDTGFALSSEHRVWRQRVSRIFGFLAAFALIIISTSMIWSYVSNAGRAF
ncbi:ABC-type nickel/cobalt efflux system, permease component RcnA [Marinomonas polaris DSM 16579]|uniref:Nickel/cobalt efflux system n=1 Tax=Marinomonas polaris DSM 16579 TaxID=1122206 RepID=A0A1M4WQS9_9GAMM|nr:nickel/cobalt transporter [Marinomonas polaris]SHE83423.1 ABC-type nickel/cobalt efflux system, permease component RcnA [Marinomonas polaris DSM 16579]